MHALIVWVVVGLAAGWLASLVLGGHGILRYIVTGLLGSIVGGFLLGLLGLSIPFGGFWVHEILTAAIGAAVVIVVARIIA